VAFFRFSFHADLLVISVIKFLSTSTFGSCCRQIPADNPRPADATGGMSYTSPELIPSQKRRAVSSTASQLGANQITAVSAISDGGSYGSLSVDRPFGLMRGQSEVPATAITVSQREPTRSFFHSSFRGHLGMNQKPIREQPS